jgi:hypothetical protein
MPPTFAEAFEHAMAELRERLLCDVIASAENLPQQGGIRSEWALIVRRLAKLRSLAQVAQRGENPPVGKCAATRFGTGTPASGMRWSAR